MKSKGVKWCSEMTVTGYVERMNDSASETGLVLVEIFSPPAVCESKREDRFMGIMLFVMQ